MSDGMDVAFINKWGRGGGEIWDLKIAEHLGDLGVDVKFFVRKANADRALSLDSFDYTEVESVDLSDAAKTAPPGIRSLIGDIDNYLFVRNTNKTINPSEFDIIHINAGPQFSRYVDSWDTPTVLKLNGPPYSFFYDRIHPFSSSYQQVESFDAVVTTGVTTEHVRENADVDVTTINPGVDTTEFKPQQEDHDNGKKILFVGRFVPIKNISFLIESFNILQEDHPDAELVLVGDGPLRDKIEEKIAKLGISESVRMPGYIDNGDLPEYYNEADVFALSSKDDNHPITLLESMSCGTPVVAPRVGWVPQMVSDEETGLLYEPGNKTELVESINRLLTDEGLRDEIGKYARKSTVEDSDWEQRARKLNNLYEDITI